MNYKILIVEDDPLWKKFLREWAEKTLTNLNADGEVKVLENVGEAFEALVPERLWHLLITDIGFRDDQQQEALLGLQLLTRAHDLNIPAIAVSGSDMVTKVDIRNMLKEYCAYDYHDKSKMQSKTLMSQMERILKPREALLNLYSDEEKVIISHLIERLTKDQVDEALSVYKDLELDSISKKDMDDIVDYLIKKLPDNLDLSSPVRDTANQISNTLIEPKLETKHKLKIMLPIIPLILTYHGEVEIGAGVKLKSLWNKFLSKK